MLSYHFPMMRPSRRAAPAVVALVAAGLSGCFLPKYEERVVEKPALEGITGFHEGPHKICVIPVEGVLFSQTREGLFGAEKGVVETASLYLRRAARDPAVKAAVLKISSPGGEVTAAELLRSEVMRFRASGKPLVAYFEGIAASGGYYVAAPADRILSHPTALTGSIGVIAVFPNIEGLMGKLGIEARVVTSGAMKDAGSPFHGMSAEEEKVFQGLIDDMYERFLAVVIDGRKGFTKETLRPVADGRIYTARQALANNLIDDIATLDKAIQTAGRLAGIPEGRPLRAVRYEIESPGLVIHVARAEPVHPIPAAQISLTLPSPALRRPGFWYLWWPLAAD